MEHEVLAAHHFRDPNIKGAIKHKLNNSSNQYFSDYHRESILAAHILDWEQRRRTALAVAMLVEKTRSAR